MAINSPFYPGETYRLPSANEVVTLTEANLVVDPTMARHPAPHPMLPVSMFELTQVSDIEQFAYSRIVAGLTEALLGAAHGHLLKITDSVVVVGREFRPWRWRQHNELIERRNKLAIELQYEVYPSVIRFASNAMTLGLICSIRSRYLPHLSQLLQSHGYNPWEIKANELFVPLNSREA